MKQGAGVPSLQSQRLYTYSTSQNAFDMHAGTQVSQSRKGIRFWFRSAGIVLGPAEAMACLEKQAAVKVTNKSSCISFIMIKSVNPVTGTDGLSGLSSRTASGQSRKSTVW